MPELTAEFFEDAVDHLDKHGWCRHSPCDSKGRVCLLGAMFQASRNGRPNLDKTDIYSANFRKILDLLGLGEVGLMHWNDNVAASAEEVRERLMLAAKKLRDEGL